MLTFIYLFRHYVNDTALRTLKMNIYQFIPKHKKLTTATTHSAMRSYYVRNFEHLESNTNDDKSATKRERAVLVVEKKR